MLHNIQCCSFGNAVSLLFCQAKSISCSTIVWTSFWTCMWFCNRWKGGRTLFSSVGHTHTFYHGVDIAAVLLFLNSLQLPNNNGLWLAPSLQLHTKYYWCWISVWYLGQKVFVVNKLHPNVGNLGWSVLTVVSNSWEFPVFMVPPEYFLVLPQLCMSDLT